MASKAGDNGAVDEERIAPAKKRGRPTKEKPGKSTADEQQTAQASTSKMATSRKLKPPGPDQKKAQAMRVEGNQLEQVADDLPMDIDVDEGSLSRINPQVNLFDQGSNGQTPVESLPDTSMLAEPTNGEINRQRKRNTASSSSSIIQRSLVTAIVKEVEDLQKSGGGSFRSIGKGKEAQYSFHANSASACYMGPIQSQTLQSVAINTGKPLAKLVDDVQKPGALFNTGGHVYSVDWLPTEDDLLQYLCISTSLEGSPKTLFGERLISEKKAARVQIWSIDDSFQTELQMILCFDQGWISTVRWVPTSTAFDNNTSTLGLLSACMQDGSVGIYAVPRSTSDGVVHITIDPLVQLNVKKGVPTAMEWLNADKLAVAYSDGWVSIWSLLSCLHVKTQRARPLLFTRVSTSPITSLAWHTDGEQIFVSSFDGSMRCMQFAHPQLSTTIYHSRDVSYSVVFSPVMGFPLMERPEADEIRSVDFIHGKSQSTGLYSHLGRVRTMSVSNHHSYIASGSVDGILRIVDLNHFITRSGKRGKAPKFNIVLPLYRLDKNRGKSALRFIENLGAQSTTQQAAHSSAAWDPEISVTAVRWNCNEEKQSWVVSSMSCGLIRIDVVDM